MLRAPFSITSFAARPMPLVIFSTVFTAPFAISIGIIARPVARVRGFNERVLRIFPAVALIIFQTPPANSLLRSRTLPAVPTTMLLPAAKMLLIVPPAVSTFGFVVKSQISLSMVAINRVLHYTKKAPICIEALSF